MGEGRVVYRILVGRPERRSLGRPRRRWEDNIKTYLQEVGWGSVDWIDMAQDRDRCLTFVSGKFQWQIPYIDTLCLHHEGSLFTEIE
jgi:hypothetical protein